MSENLALSEVTVRLIAFLSIFSAMALFEILAPRREPMPAKGRRWRTNISIVVIDSIVLRIVFPMAAVGTAVWAHANNIGLLPVLGLPVWLAGLILFIALDFAVWLEHVVSHKWPILWRIHRMHHSDPDFDLTTALRFHPLEILLSMVWKAAIILALGGPVLAVLIFEIVLNGAAMFNHSNARLPLWLDRTLRLIIVTPDMHRIHHSVINRETDSNYGFNFSFWDRIFRTYTIDPEKGHRGMTIGLNEYQDDRPTGILWSLALPFKPLLARDRKQVLSDQKSPIGK